MTMDALNGPEPEAFRLVVFIASDRVGEGDPVLGGILMRSALKVLKDFTPQPATLLFMNSGVRLVCEGSELLTDLQAAEARGIELLSCGTCLDYFHLKDKLQAGRVSNMAEILGRMANASQVIRL